MIEFELHKKLNASFGSMNFEASAQLSQGTFCSIYGPSGVGKTSLLRMLAGLMKPDKGSIKVFGEIWYDSELSINLPPQQRSIGIVFQDYGLFPNMTVQGNLEFALSKNQSSHILNEMIEVMELGDLVSKKPLTLSGGQQQRVALARALIRKPKLLLLDEPLSALDQDMREKMQTFILKIHRKYKINSILVSHLFSEVVKMSDHIVMLSDGKVINQGIPTEIFNVHQMDNKPEVEAIIIEKKLCENEKVQLTVIIGDKLYLTPLVPDNQNWIKGSKIIFDFEKLSLN